MELVNETAPFAVILVAFAGRVIAAVKSVQLVLSFEPCNFKLEEVAANISVADVFWIYSASNWVGLKNWTLKISLPFCDCAVAVENWTAAAVASLSVRDEYLLFGDNVFKAEVMLITEAVLSTVFHSLAVIKQVGDSSASKIPSLSSSISNKSAIPSPSVFAQAAIFLLKAYSAYLEV